MPLPQLLLPPDQESYQFSVGENNVAVKLAGGASRFRADQLGNVFDVDVQWSCNKKNYEYLNAFYRTAISYGSLPFTIDLLLEDGTMRAYTAHFQPDTFKLALQKGDLYIMTATLEVLPDASYTTGDATIITAGPDV